MRREIQVGVLAVLALLGMAVIALGAIEWFPLGDFTVKQGGPGMPGITLIIHNDASKPLRYIMIQFPFAAYERIEKIDCTAIGPGKVEKIEKGYTLGIYFSKEMEFAPNSHLYCALAIKDATPEELQGYIDSLEKLVIRARGMAQQAQ